MIKSGKEKCINEHLRVTLRPLFAAPGFDEDVCTTIHVKTRLLTKRVQRAVLIM
jgi:hypothetical protein